MSISPYVLAIIPARSGSKSVPHKNIQSLKGKPMLVYSIEHALAAASVSRVMVNTDDAYYAELSRSAGAEVPFLRPAELAQDHSTDLEVFAHCLQWLQAQGETLPDIVVHLRPTSPLRHAADIDAMVQLLIDNPQADSVRSIVENPEPAFKMWFMEKEGQLKPVVENAAFPEAYNLPRQALPKTYIQNACIDVTRSTTILQKHSMTGSHILGYLMQDFTDIDHYHQLNALQIPDSERTGAKTFVVDIDGVIAFLSPDNNYHLAKGNPAFIEKVNELYDKGNTIVLFTARGSKTGIDWRATTESQLQQWGVKYHELRLGKPFADFYVDDRLLSPVEFLQY